MTQENKELLLRDLSARLPYGVIVDYKESVYDFNNWKIDSLHSPAYSKSGILIDTDYEGWISFTEYKGCGMSTGSRPLHLEKNLPFLRSMSSMTKEEKRELLHYGGLNISSTEEVLDVSCVGFDRHAEVQDWLNRHFFDYRGLIPLGLALEAPKDMYK